MTDHPDSVRTATNRAITVVKADKEDYGGSNNYFRSTGSEAFTDTPTNTITLSSTLPGVDIKAFEMTNVSYYMEPQNTSAQTYQIWLFSDNQADNTTSYGTVIFNTSSAQAQTTVYEWGPGGRQTHSSVGVLANEAVDYQLPKIVTLGDKNVLYYIIKFAASSTTSVFGYIKIRGKLLK